MDPQSKRSARSASRPRAPRAAAAAYDRARAEQYWGQDRLRLGDEFRIVLSAGEAPYVNAAYHRWETETLVRALGAVRGARVLDLACGLGRVARVLAARGAQVVGADNASAMLRAARASLRRVRGAAARRARWAQAVTDRLPFADASFDAVICFGILEHLPQPLQRGTLTEARRVLAPGGWLYLVVNNNHSLLLRSGEDNRFRRAVQLDNGYFCGLVDRRSLVAGLARAGAQVDALGSNAHYSLLRHSLRGRVAGTAARAEAARAFAEATERDLCEARQGWLGEACADHFLYRIRRSGPRRTSRPRPARWPRR
jgi:SAM-dependent methyltransferase